MDKYRKLNFNNLKYAKDTISFDEAVKNSEIASISGKITDGSKQVLVTNAKKDYKNKCVKLEIYY